MPFLTLFLSPLGPALLLLLGGFGVAIGDRLVARIEAARLPPGPRPRLPYRRHAVAFMGSAAVAAAIGLLVRLRSLPTAPVLSWLWQPLTVSGSTVEWRLDGWSALAALVILLVTAAALALGVADQTDAGRAASGVPATLWLAAAAVAFVTAGNVVALAAAWLALDAALVLSLRPDEHAEPAGRAWSMSSLAAVLGLLLLVLLGEGNIRATLTNGPFGPLALALLWLLALVRAGVYPLHFWLTGPGRPSRAIGLNLHIIAPLAGLWLAGRVHGAAPVGWLHRPEWAALGALALVGTALAAWAGEDEHWRWRWIAINRASLVIMAAYMVQLSGPQALVWALVAFGPAMALLAVGMAARERLGWRWPVALAALMLWGLPGTPGFLARSILVYPTTLSVAVPLFVILLVAETILAAALWRAAAAPATPQSWGESSRRGGMPFGSIPRAAWPTVGWLGLAAALLVAPTLVWGLAPGSLARLVGFPADALPSLGGFVAEMRRSAWAALLLSGVGGAALGLAHERIFAHVRGWQAALAAVVSLDWFYRGVGGVLGLAMGGLRYFASLGEGEGYLGWLALSGLIVWVLLRG